MSEYYVIDDTKQKIGCRKVSANARKVYNSVRYGIFHLVNKSDGKGRKKSNMVRLRAWFCEFDDVAKDSLPVLIKSCPAHPSLIIESRNGFHFYWLAVDATFKQYDKIQSAIQTQLPQADRAVRETNRLLRSPGFYNWKTPDKPFAVQVVFKDRHLKYTDEQMIYYFDAAPQKPGDDIRKHITGVKSHCLEKLQQLSGTKYVNNEVYTFKKNTDGTQQIVVNGKLSGAWIDKNGWIGSYTRGGPTIRQWLRWFDNGNVLEALRYIAQEG